jgi:hypothetical protein
MASMLGRLGFRVRDCGSGNHKAFSHSKLAGFFGGNYNCGHGKNPPLKPVYVRKIIRILEEWEADLR